MESLARSLRETGSPAAYSRLAAFATRRDSAELGARAALALGYFSYTKGRYADARQWLARAQGDSVLREYVLYWQAEVDRMMGQNDEALVQLENFRRRFPDSVMNEAALQSLAEMAVALRRPEPALEALASNPAVDTKPALLFVRAQARDLAGQAEAAASDYLAVHYRFPLSAQAKESEEKLKSLAGTLGDRFPSVPLEERISRAAALFEAREWRAARAEYEKLLPSLAGADRERAELREVQSRVASGESLEALAGLTLSDPEIDAERLYDLAQMYRARGEEAEMLAALEAAVARAPLSHLAEQALFSAGNYFWVLLDRDRAAAFYRRLVDGFPTVKDAAAAEWRIAWTAYAERRPGTASLMEGYVRNFAASPFTPDALYWLGRAAERAGNAALARAYFGKLQERFPQTYFGGRAAVRLEALGLGPSESVAVLAAIPPPPAAAEIGGPTPVAAGASLERARALEAIAFDASAELELRAAYAATGSSRLLVEAAQAALEAEHYPAAIVTVRQLFPQLEAHRFGDVPDEIWRTAYPLPYPAEIRRSAARAGIDPMLVAALIRQESAFAPDARSGPGAIGLMQILPRTARRLARKLRLGYSQARLFDPEYNLRLGTVYFAELLSAYGSQEAALAAYNAGEDRVALWQSGRNFEETAEFVESIPFTETREYVEIVIRNAAIYRKLYGEAP